MTGKGNSRFSKKRVWAVAMAGCVCARLVAADAAPPVAAGFGLNPYRGMREREEVFEFAEKPAVARQGDGFVVSFAVKAACDATVAVVGPDGKVVRHLASGVLGPNAPWPFRQDSLSQRIEWDGKDNDGKPVPAESRVRVSLGLNAEFERFKTWRLMQGIRPLAVGGDGELFAIGTTEITGGIHVFGRDGGYVRTILPAPAFEADERKIEPERFGALIQWNRTTRGAWVPRRHRFGGGFDFELTNRAGFWNHVRSATLTPDGRLLALYWAGRHGRLQTFLFAMDTRDGACSAEDVADLGGLITTGSMAPSPDGQWLYFSGRPAPPKWRRSDPFNHAVFRMSLKPMGKPEVFVGKPGEAGDVPGMFDGPSSVACDKDGNLYVHDSGNGRVQVFRPDGKHLKSIPVEATGLVGVSHRTGGIFLWYQRSWSQSPRLFALGGLENPETVAETTLQGDWPGGQWREGMQSAILSAGSNPPQIWFAGMNYRKDRQTLLGVEFRDGALVRTVDAIRANEGLPDAGGDVLSHGAWASLHANRRENTLHWHPVDRQGLEYRRGMFWQNQPEGIALNAMSVFRVDPKTGAYVSFEKGAPAFQGGSGSFLNPYEPLIQDGLPVIGLSMYYARGSHHHQGPFCVAPNGDIYVSATYGEQYDAELESAGLPRLDPKRFRPISSSLVRVYGPDGTLKTPNALPGLAYPEGLRVGRSGAIYVVQPWKPAGQKLPDGLAEGSYDDSRWGALLKFQGDFKTFPVGRIEGAWDAEPSDPTHQGDGRRVKASGALWTYAGVSPFSGKYSACTCMRSSSDLDDFERSWVVAAQTCTVNAIDANGNVMARIGGYANMDSQGPASAVMDPETGALRARRPDDPTDRVSPLRAMGFILPRNVAASDDTLWVADIGHRALIRARLIYRTQAEAPLKNP